MRTSKLTLAMAAAFFAASSLFGQVTTSYLNVAAGDGVDTTLAVEKIDYVTVGSTMPYSVLPDQTINSLRTNTIVESQFSWVVSGGTNGALRDTSITTALIAPVAAPWYANPNGATSNAAFVGSYNWNALGSWTITVTERTVDGASAGTMTGCTDATPETLPVTVIARPTAFWTESAANTGFTKGDCWDGAADITIGLTVGGSGVYQLSYDMDFSGIDDITTVDGSETKTDTVVVSDAFVYATPTVAGVTTGEIVYVPAAGAFGKYVFEMTNITDHISRKSGVNAIGTDLCGVGEEYTMYLMPTPVTQPVRHIKNVGVAY